MTTKQAFTELTSNRGWYKEAGLDPVYARTLKKRFTDGKLISIEKLEEVLEAAGYKVVQEKKWDKD